MIIYNCYLIIYINNRKETLIHEYNEINTTLKQIFTNTSTLYEITTFGIYSMVHSMS